MGRMIERRSPRCSRRRRPLELRPRLRTRLSLDMVPSVMSPRRCRYRSRSPGRAPHARPRTGLVVIAHGSGRVRRPAAARAALLSTSGGGGASRLQVVAAENFWGSIASQLGRRRGDGARASSSTPTPTRTATSRRPPTRGRSPARKLAIVNGIGYDNWASKLLAANPLCGPRRRSTSATCSACRPATTRTSGTRPRSRAARDRRDHRRLRRGSTRRRRATSRASEQTFETTALARYDALIAQIRARYAGVAGRLQREHLPAARRRPRPDAADARTASPRRSPRAPT